MKKWRFGIIGTGLIADFHARAINDIENAELTGVYDISGQKTSDFAGKFSVKACTRLDELFEIVDIVTIATPSGAHLEPSVAAAGAGVHVICEKPLEISTERIDAMIQAHKNAGTCLGGVFQFRFIPALEPLRKAVKEGRFGNISYVGAYVPWWRTDEYYKDSWHGTLKLDGGGALMNQSIHVIDMLVELMWPVESVQAYTAAIAHDIEAEDTATATVKFGNGALGLIYGTTASWPGQFKRFEISGSKGTAVYLEDSYSVWQFQDETQEDDEVREKFGKIKARGSVADPAAISYKNHMLNFQAFLDSLDKGTEFIISPQEARKSVELIQAIYKSSKEGCLVKL